jgi:hypothetical protein
MPGERQLDAFYLKQTNPSLDCMQTSHATLPLSRWVCVEWHFDGKANLMQFWIDGQPIDELTVSDPATRATCSVQQNGSPGPWLAPVFEKLSLGFWNAAAEGDGPMEMWLDDIGLDVDRVGCAPNPP